MVKRLLPLLLIVFAYSAIGQTIQLYNEDFEGAVPFTLNSSNQVGTPSGVNKWRINNQYSGAPLYPNTTPQNQTVSGNISFAPNSNYLHICDTVSQQQLGISNANFNPAISSDQFAYTSDGFCTLGFTDVTFAFFWLAEGNSNGYGEVYYSVNSGPWVQIGLSQYKNQTLWKYETLSDPALDNKPNVRFGFRWVNGSSGPPASMSFAVDDINVVGTYNQATGVQLTIPQLFNVPVCQGSSMLVNVQLSDTLCDGAYLFQMSDANGSFANPYTFGFTYFLSYTQTNVFIQVQIPVNIPAGTCYKLRFVRTTPDPVIVGEASVCFEIVDCPNTITTAPGGVVAIADPDTICAGSVVDIPFYSTGYYVANSSQYIAQLSRPDGTFPATPPYTVLGFLSDNTTYDPAQGSPPGNVSGLIPDTVSPGCNYYIRIISTNPSVTGSIWGPFCIKRCDIETNNKQDIRFCINEISGADTTITYTIHNYNNNAVYNPGNQFVVQVISSQNWAIVNTGGLGATVDTQSGTVSITVPNLNGLLALGITPGMYYLRVIATDSNTPLDLNGTLVRITIGAPSAFPPTITSDKPFYCAGELAQYLITPDHFGMPWQSEYEWWSNGMNFVGGQPQPFFWDYNPLFVYMNGIGSYEFVVTEYNNGCTSPVSDTLRVDVFGSPNVTITGPSQVCIGDTATYQVQFTNNTYYEWAVSANVSILDTSNNIITVVFDSSGANSLQIEVVNPCGNDNGNKNILVKKLPEANAGNDTTVCAGTQVTLQSNQILSGQPQYSWNIVDGSNVGTGTTVNVTPDSTTAYYIKITINPGCVNYDTVTVFTETPPPPLYDTTNICIDGMATFDAGAGQNYTYLWSSGETSQTIDKNTAGVYTVDIAVPGELCLTSKTFVLEVDTCYIPPQVPDVFTPNGDGVNDYWQLAAAGDFDEFEVLVYNRWGTMVYKTNDPKFKWDGKNMNGNMVSPGVYYYVARTLYQDKAADLHGAVSILHDK